MKLTQEQIKSIVTGALCCHQEERGLLFTRHTPQQLAAWQKAAPELVVNLETTTGIRLDFHTDSSQVTFEVDGGKKYELWVDGVLVNQFKCQGICTRATYRVTLGAPGQMKRVVFALPSHTPPAYICGVTLDDGAKLQPHQYDCRVLFLGDSITQGWNSAFDTLSYAYLVSQGLNADSVIHGIGGAFFEPTVLCDMTYAADLVLVALGTNDFGRFDTLQQIENREREYLTIVKEKFPQARICVITPIWREDWHILKSCGSFAQCCDSIRQVAQSLSLEVIDGMKLMPNFSEFMADALHPNDLGFMQYANNLLSYLQKDK